MGLQRRCDACDRQIVSHTDDATVQMWYTGVRYDFCGLACLVAWASDPPVAKEMSDGAA